MCPLFVALFAACTGAVRPMDSADSGRDSPTPEDSADSGLVADLVPISGPTCTLEEIHNLGWVIGCSSYWADVESAALDGGSLDWDLLDASGTYLADGTLTISSTVGGPVAALADGTVTLYLAPVEETES